MIWTTLKIHMMKSGPMYLTIRNKIVDRETNINAIFSYVIALIISIMTTKNKLPGVSEYPAVSIR